ncbi:MAG: hypothetical protein IK017_03300 [Paludibacteraceae bacterium]|nr:hypothetical protein [Paludibacteraceae bacterium]
MKKLFLLVSAALLSFNMFAGEQGDDNGFEIKLFAGFAGDKYGTKELSTDVYGAEVKHELPELPGMHKTPELGLALASRWYVATPAQFGIGIQARWLDFGFAHKEWDILKYKDSYGATETNNFVNIGMFGPGVVGTFYLNDKMAVDAYYNIVPTLMITTDKYEYESEYLTYMGSNFVEKEDKANFGLGWGHYFGAAFRYNVFQVGVEYNIAKIKAMNWGDDDETDDLLDDLTVTKYNMNNFRVFVGFKF